MRLLGREVGAAMLCAEAGGPRLTIGVPSVPPACATKRRPFSSAHAGPAAGGSSANVSANGAILTESCAPCLIPIILPSPAVFFGGWTGAALPVTGNVAKWG